MLSDQNYTSYIGARRRSDLIGEFKEPFNKLCNNLDNYESHPCTDNEFFHLAEDTESFRNLSDVDLDDEVKATLIKLAELLTEQQRREIETIRQYYKKH